MYRSVGQLHRFLCGEPDALHAFHRLLDWITDSRRGGFAGRYQPGLYEGT